MPAPVIIDPFHKMVYDALQERLLQRSAYVLAGNPSTMEEYRAHLGYISALNDVLEICQELERTRYGDAPVSQQQ